MNEYPSKAALITALLIGSIGTGVAATIEIDNISGSWTGATPGSAVTGLNTNTISWGVPAAQAGQSSYVFTGSNPIGVSLNESFDIGKFTHNNNPIFAPTLTSATLSVSFDLTIDGGTTTTYSSVFDFTHLETPNNDNPCAGPSNSDGCYDQVTFAVNKAQTDTFTIDGKEYSFTLSGFLIDGNLADEFWTKEKNSNTATLQGSVSVSQVPIPAALWLFGSALISLAGIGYRQRSPQTKG